MPTTHEGLECIEDVTVSAVSSNHSMSFFLSAFCSQAAFAQVLACSFPDSQVIAVDLNPNMDRCDDSLREEQYPELFWARTWHTSDFVPTSPSER